MKNRIITRWHAGNDFQDGDYISFRGILYHRGIVKAITANTVLGNQTLVGEINFPRKALRVSQTTLNDEAMIRTSGGHSYLLPISWKFVNVPLVQSGFKYILDHHTYEYFLLTDVKDKIPNMKYFGGRPSLYGCNHYDDIIMASLQYGGTVINFQEMRDQIRRTYWDNIDIHTKR